MAKGGGRGKGRPKKTAILAQSAIGAGNIEIGECSTGGVSSDDAKQEEMRTVEILTPVEVQPTPVMETEKVDPLPQQTVDKILPLRSKGMKLGYVAPTIKQGKPTACLDKSELEKENLKWKKAIILYVIGESPTITFLNMYLRKQCLIGGEF